MDEPSRIIRQSPLKRPASILFVAALSIAAYLNTLWNGFVWDDRLQVLNNQWIRDFSNIPDIFTNCVWSFCGDKSSFYRPVMHLVYMLDFHLFGLAPWGFHLVNVLLNSAVCVMVFLVTERLVRDHDVPDPRAASFIPIATAVIFAVHPIHSEPVAWVAGVPDLTYGFFFLLSFYLYMVSFRPDGRRAALAFSASVFALFLSMLSKEPAVTLPGVLVCYDYTTRRFRGKIGSHAIRYVPYLAVMSVYFVIRYLVLGGFISTKVEHSLVKHWNLMNAFPLFVGYLQKLLLPFNLSAFYEFHKASSVFEPRVLLAVAVTAGFAAALMYQLRRRSMAAVGLALVALPLIPALYSTGVLVSALADRYLYIPVLGFGLLLSMAFVRIASRFPGSGRMLLAGLTAVAILYLAGTVARNGVWKDDYTLSSDMVRKAPNSAVVHAEYGLAVFSRGEVDKAIGEYMEAIRINPGYAEAHSALGGIYGSMGQLDKAVEEIQKAIDIEPGYAGAYCNLGVAYAVMGKPDMAAEQFREAIRLTPQNELAHANLGIAYMNMGQSGLAEKQFEEALELNPRDAVSREKLETLKARDH